jgi:hypothetical protein
MLNRRVLAEIGREVVDLVSDYHGGPKREMLIDPVLYALLRTKYARVTRQYHAHLPNAQRPPRIDFRVGGTNPVLIEVAVRPPHGTSELYGSQNASELRKLTRFSNQRAKLRALLLIDLHGSPHDFAALQATYDKVNAGRGKFTRHPVQIVYVHASGTFGFKWDPYVAA